MRFKIITLGLLLAALFGCSKQQERRHIVILPDVSGSINQQSIEQMFKMIDDVAHSLHRGDKLTIIPILADADAETSGRIMRFEVPTNRHAYDSDLQEFHSKFKAILQSMKDGAVAHPGSKTDILG